MARRRRRARRTPLFGINPAALLLLAILLILIIFFVRDGDGIHLNLGSLGDSNAAASSSYAARSGLHLTHPAGWVVSETEGIVTVANNFHALESAELDPGDVSITILPPYPPVLLQEFNTTMQEAPVNRAQARYAPDAAGAPVEDSIGGRPATRVPLTARAAEGFGVAIELPDGHVVLAFVDSAPGTLATQEGTVREILSSLRYEIPEPTSPPA